MEIFSILSGLINQVLNFFFYFRHKKNERINSVVQKYIKLYEQNKDTGLSALLKTNIYLLKNDTEIKKCLELIVSRINKYDQVDDIFGSSKSKTYDNYNKIKLYGLKKFFKKAKYYSGRDKTFAFKPISEIISLFESERDLN